MTARLPCAVSADLARHLDAEALADARADAVDARCTLLMASGAEYCPTTARAVGEALGDALTDPDSELLPMLTAALLGDVRSSEPGHLIRTACLEYWAQLALKEAEKQIDAERKAAAEDAAEDAAESAREYQQDWSAA